MRSQSSPLPSSASPEVSRSRVILRTSLIGIVVNVLLAAFKAAVGLITHSIAVVLDAVNNFSDATSSLVTIIGIRLAARQPDRDHPFGHGRAEYLSALIISVIILYAGLTSFAESVRKIMEPSSPDYTLPSLIIIGVSIVAKIFLGRYVKGVGQQVNSDSLVNSGEDARLDAVITASTLVAAIIFLLTGIRLEAWLGAVISLVIIKSGIGMLRDTVSRLLGEPADAALAADILKTVNSYEPVKGAYDLVLNNYGPDTWSGSVHIEVEDTFPVELLDRMIRRITADVYVKHRVILTAIGVYSQNTKDPEAVNIRAQVREMALSHPYVTQMHGFFIDRAEKIMRFDLVVSFDAPNREEVYQSVVEQVQAAWPDYHLETVLDTDFIH